MEKSLSDLRKIVVPEFVYGNGARYLLGNYVNNFNLKKVMVVSDHGVQNAGWTGELLDILETAGIAYSLFLDVTANPKDFEIMKGVEQYLDECCEALVAIGGGSPMDCAKGIGIVATNGGSITDYEGVDEVPEPCPPYLFIPTTAGTSADVSQFAIVTDCSDLRKFAIISKTVVPDISLIDPEVTMTMNRELTLHTGLDALTHAIEAFVSNASSSVSDLHAMEAIRLIFKHLLSVLEHPDSSQHRTGMMEASLHAGIAFSNASLGLVHAMSHSLGGYKDFPHGESNAILLPFVLEFNKPFIETRCESILHMLHKQGISSGSNADSFIYLINDLNEKAGLRNTLRRSGIGSEDIPNLAKKAFHDPCMVTNPREVSVEEIEVIYEKALRDSE